MNMSTTHSCRASAIACLALMTVPAAHAEQASGLTDTAAPNADMRYVAASVQRDAQHGQAVIALLSLPVADRGWVQFGGGQTRHEQNATARKAKVLSAGAGYIGGSVGSRWQASLVASHRDAGRDLRQTDWDGVLEWQGEPFGVGIDGHHRVARGASTLATPTAPAGMPVEQRIKGRGVGLHGNVRLTDSFRLYAATMRYDYRVSTTSGSSAGGSGGGTSLLSRTLLPSAPSFVSREETALNRSSRFGVSHRSEKLTVSGEFIADRVLDEPGTVRTVQLKAALYLTPQWTVTPTLGHTRSKTHGGVSFAGLAASHGW